MTVVHGTQFRMVVQFAAIGDRMSRKNDLRNSSDLKTFLTMGCSYCTRRQS
jgi:hypothetical protein